MIIADVVQGTTEWQAARCGIPTASNFGMIITCAGLPSKQATKYMHRLAGERVAGKAEESYQSASMLRGIEMEAEAAEWYELSNDCEAQKAGLCYRDESKLYACSPDRLIGEDGLLEIKCPEIHTHVGYLLDNELPMDYFQQIQGQLFVTGRKWADFMSYYPGIKPLIVRAYRDEKFLKALHIELEKFCIELENITRRIQ